MSELVLEWEDNYLFFGDALIPLGVPSEQEMFRHLKTFNTVKLKKQFEQEKQEIQRSVTSQNPSDLQEFLCRRLYCDMINRDIRNVPVSRQGKGVDKFQSFII